MASFGSEIGVVALEHFTKDLFIAGNEQVVARFGVRNDLARQRSGQFEIGRAARTLSRRLDEPARSSSTLTLSMKIFRAAFVAP